MGLSMSLLGFGMEPMLANFHIYDIMLALRAIFNMQNARYQDYLYTQASKLTHTHIANPAV